jgi:short-subunit dehydrogenase
VHRKNIFYIKQLALRKNFVSEKNNAPGVLMGNATGQVVVITGASAGVGRATAIAFAREGADVALLARSADGLQSAVDEINALGGTALALQTDVADAEQVEDAAKRVEQILGPIDVWVNNAMVTVFSRALDISPAEYRRVTEVTYLGTVHGTLAALRRMRERNRGCIIQVGSALAYRSIPLQSAYCAAKFAVRGFTDSLRSELIDEKSAIHLTMVQLAAFNTPQFEWARSHLPTAVQPLPPIFQPEVAASAIVWSAKNKRRELLVGFPALKTIWGNKVLPGLADHMAAKDAVSGQQDEDFAKKIRKDNLFKPAASGYQTRGRFDAEARDRSWQLIFSTHREIIGVVVFLFFIFLVAIFLVA